MTAPPLTAGEALQAFMRRHGLDVRDYTAPGFRVRLGPLVLPFPNPGRLHQHDLHHLALGAPPTFWGEVQVSAFELRSGAPTRLIAFLCVGALLLGALLSPRRVLGWWRGHAGCRNLYGQSDHQALLATPLETLRQQMGLGAGP